MNLFRLETKEANVKYWDVMEQQLIQGYIMVPLEQSSLNLGLKLTNLFASFI